MADLSIAWRDARVVEWARLEREYTRKGIRGSNPLLSASQLHVICNEYLIMWDSKGKGGRHEKGTRLRRGLFECSTSE